MFFKVRCLDFDVPVVIQATPENVGETVLSTTLVAGDVKISTIEHLLSAFAGLGIDNAIIDVSPPKCLLWMAVQALSYFYCNLPA